MVTLDLQSFCTQLGDIVNRFAVEDLPARVADLLPAVLGKADLLTAGQRTVPPNGYGRHELFVCPGDGFSILALVWPPGISTPIHDHAQWCAVGMYEGAIRETRYAPAGTDGRGRALASATTVAERRPGDVMHLPVYGPNIHRIDNPGDRPAVSIHIYGGNWRKLGPNVDTVYGLAA